MHDHRRKWEVVLAVAPLLRLVRARAAGNRRDLDRQRLRSPPINATATATTALVTPLPLPRPPPSWLGRSRILVLSRRFEITSRVWPRSGGRSTEEMLRSWRSIAPAACRFGTVLVFEAVSPRQDARKAAAFVELLPPPLRV